ncbi:MAG: hypothetical protein K1X55_05200 [Chitinophagales bacterium]|nr:hypothetical protein [Chitinophagales bacterium]
MIIWEILNDIENNTPFINKIEFIEEKVSKSSIQKQQNFKQELFDCLNQPYPLQEQIATFIIFQEINDYILRKFRFWRLLNGRDFFQSSSANYEMLINIDIDFIHFEQFDLYNILFDNEEAKKFVLEEIQLYDLPSKSKLKQIFPGLLDKYWNQTKIDTYFWNEIYINYASFKTVALHFLPFISILTIGVSLIVLCFIFTFPNWLNMLLGIGGSLIVLLGLFLLQSIFDEYYKLKKPKYFNQIDLALIKPYDKAIEYSLAVVGGCIHLISFAVLGKYVENTIHVLRYIGILSVGGVAIAIFLYKLGKMLLPHFFIENERRMGYIGFFLLSIIAFTISFPIYYNAVTPQQSKLLRVKICDNFTSTKESPIFRKKYNDYFHIEINKECRRFELSADKMRNFIQKDSIDILIYKGSLGIEYVADFDIIQSK